MNYKEQLINKKIDTNEVLKGEVTRLEYEEYLYYLACLSLTLYKKRRYREAFHFFEHMCKSAVFATKINEYLYLGKKVPKEVLKYNIGLKDFLERNEIKYVTKQISKIPHKHKVKRNILQSILIFAAVALYCLLYMVFNYDQTISAIASLAIPVLVPFLFNFKPIDLNSPVTPAKELLVVTRVNEELIDFVEKQAKKDHEKLIY